MENESVENRWFKTDCKSQYREIVNRKVFLSKNLVFRKNCETGKLLINRLSSTAIKSSKSLLDFLSLIRKKPVPLSSLLAQYSDSDSLDSITHLLKINFLISDCINEDLEWLKKRIDMSRIKQFETKHFITLYSGGVDYPARNFSDFMEDVFSFLSLKHFLAIHQKITIYICKDRDEFKEFWGSAPLPDWPKAFVFSSNLLIVDQQKILQLDIGNEGSFQGMMHELVHILLGQMTCQLPVWLEEGLCEYFSKSNSDKAFLSICRQKRIYGFKEIELFARQSLLDLDDSQVMENICYRQSHSFVAYLMRLKGEKYFMDCIASMGIDSTFKSRFQAFYDLSVDDAEQEWRKKYSGIQVTRLKISKNLRVIKSSHNVLLYNAFYGQSLKASPDILFLIECFKNSATLSEISKKYDLEDLDSIITGLFDKRLIVFDQEQENNKVYRNFDQEQIKKGMLVNKLRLNLSNLCNMTCDYCYFDPSQKEQMDWPTAQKALTLFFDLQKQSGQRHAQIRFFGGEPLLNWPVMEQVFEYVEHLENNIKVDYILNTNGTIVTEKIARELALNKVNISVSLDGLRKIHDRFRKFKSGKGSFSKINRNIDNLVSSGCKVFISATVGNHNYNALEELITYIADKKTGFNSNIFLSLQSMCMGSKRQLDTVPIEEKVRTVRDAVLYARKINVNIDFGMIMFPFHALLGLKAMGAYCNVASGEEICIYPNGDIYPCGALTTKMGNIENFDAIFKTKEYLNLLKRVTGNIPACKGCDIEAFCAGGCVADAFIGGKHIFSPTKNCLFEQLIFKEFVKDCLNEIHE